MSGFIEGESRSQATLLPERIDDYIAEENAVRVIDVFVDELDFSGLGFKTIPEVTGLPPVHDAEAVHLRLPQSRPVLPAPGTRSRAQRRADVVDGQAAA